MNGFLGRYQTDKESEENGKWVDFGDGIRVKMTRITSSRSKEVRRKLERPLARKARGQDLPLEQLEYLLIEQLAQAVVLDWEGVTDSNGKILPHSVEAARKIFTEFADFREDVASAALSRDTFKEEAAEEELGN